MTTLDYSDNPGYRLSTADRDKAVTELRQHVSEGRLTEAEFTRRSKTARTAATRGDLGPLFDDLPATTFPSTNGSAGSAPPASSAPRVEGASAVQDAVPPYGEPDGALVQPVPSGSGAVSPETTAPAATASWSDPKPREVGRVGVTVMAIVPIVSLALFFVTGSVFSWSYSWLWFALVPVAGIIIYGPGGRPKR